MKLKPLTMDDIKRIKDPVKRREALRIQRSNAIDQRETDKRLSHNQVSKIDHFKHREREGLRYRKTHPLKTIKCPVCNKKFKQKRSNQKFCSPRCSKGFNETELKTLICPGCKRQFKQRMKTNQKFCTPTCAVRYHGRKIKNA